MPQIRANSVLPVIAMLTFTVVAAEIFVILPLLVGAMVERLGLTTRQAGFIGGADMLGAAISSFVVYFFMSRGDWRAVLSAGLFLLAVANAVSGLLNSFSLMFPTRIVAGLGEGILLAIANASIAETRHPDRVFGISMAAQVVFGTTVLYMMPEILKMYGLSWVFWGLAVLNILTAILIRHMPAAAMAPRDPGTVTSRGLSLDSATGLAGVFVYFMAQGAVWAYLDQMGIANRIEAPSVAAALAFSSVAGFGGASLASWLDIRHGRLKPLLAAALCTIVSLLVLNRVTTFIAFTAMVSLFYFAWNVSSTYQFGTLALIDSSRRTVALGSVAVFAGLAAGPLFASVLVGVGSFARVNWMAMSLCTISIMLFGSILLPMERADRNCEGSHGGTG